MNEPIQPKRVEHPRATNGDRALIALFLDGDAQAAAEALRLIRGAVKARGFYIPAAERAEVVQETMMQLVQHLADPTRTPPRSFSAFVRTLAYRRCVDWMRRQTSVEPVSDELPAGADSAETSLLDRERRAIGNYVLGSLRASCRDLIQRHTMEGLTFRQIAETDGRLEKTVRNQMYKCLDQARSLVDRVQQRARLGIRVFGKAGS